MPITVRPGFVIPDSELSVRFRASGGPGGQHANKAATRVELVWMIVDSTAVTDEQRRRLVERFGAELRVVADDERSQLRNRHIAEQRLASRVRTALEVRRARRATKPSKSSQRRRVDAKRRRSQTKQLRQRPSSSD